MSGRDSLPYSRQPGPGHGVTRLLSPFRKHGISAMCRRAAQTADAVAIHIPTYKPDRNRPIHIPTLSQTARHTMKSMGWRKATNLLIPWRSRVDSIAPIRLR